MGTFYTSDTHFGHGRIIEHCRRPFAHADQMDEALIRNWNEVVSHGDVVWHLGDFALERDPDRVQSTFHRLNGTKHLVVGNHDEGVEAILTLPWASVGRLVRVEDEGRGVALCHYPMRTWFDARGGDPLLFGHLHGRLRGTSSSVDVGVDAWGFRPVTLAQARDRMRGLPPDPDFERGRLKGRGRA